MPTYQYRCTECGHDLEAVQKFTDAALTECPSCTGQLRKIFNAVGVVFKGSGFYRTDSREKSSAAKGNGSETSAAAKAESKSEPKADSGSKSTSGSSSSGAVKSDSGSAAKQPAGAGAGSSSTGSTGS